MDLHSLGDHLLGLSEQQLGVVVAKASRPQRQTIAQALELAKDDRECKADLGVWAERKRGFVNAPFHWEWYRLIQSESRLCVLASREHSKSESFTINQSAWRSIYNPAHWTYVFALAQDQAEEMLRRINEALEQVAPWMLEVPSGNKTDWTYANGSRVTVAGAGKAVRGTHPDLIVGDDVLDERNTLTHLQRKRLERWWLGTVGGMSHPGTYRIHDGAQLWMPPTRVHLVGTPFHSADLLMGLKANKMYRWRRYSAEYNPDDLADGLAVEAA